MGGDLSRGKSYATGGLQDYRNHTGHHAPFTNIVAGWGAGVEGRVYLPQGLRPTS